jgi:hypothetical protein
MKQESRYVEACGCVATTMALSITTDLSSVTASAFALPELKMLQPDYQGSCPAMFQHAQRCPRETGRKREASALRLSHSYRFSRPESLTPNRSQPPAVR